MDSNQRLQKILDAVTSATTGDSKLIEDFDSVIFTLATTGNANGTLKFQISMQEIAPDFSAAQSPTNQWTYVEIVDLENGIMIDGEDGVVLSGADAIRSFEANISAARWICATLDPVSAGTWHVGAKPMRSN